MHRLIATLVATALAGLGAIYGAIILLFGWIVGCDKWGSASELILSSDPICGNKGSHVLTLFYVVLTLSGFALLIYPVWRWRFRPYMGAVYAIIFECALFLCLITGGVVLPDTTPEYLSFVFLLGVPLVATIAARRFLKRALAKRGTDLTPGVVPRPVLVFR